MSTDLHGGIAAAEIDGAGPLRIGAIGASRIAVTAISEPAADTGDRLVAVAARDPARGAAYARQHGWQRAVTAYEDILIDPEVELVYIGLPNALHAAWARRALAAGKHVLLEKPAGSNAADFDAAAAALDGSTGWLWEAWHYRHHPRFHAFLDAVRGQRVGTPEHVEIRMLMPAPGPQDPRWQFDLAGGALMDLGCYALNALLRIAEAGGLPAPRVTTAHAVPWRLDHRVDASITAELALGEVPANITASMAGDFWDFSVHLRGTVGELHLPHYLHPEQDDRLRIIDAAGEQHTEHHGARRTYAYQLETVRRELRAGVRDAPELERSRATMRLLDDTYHAAGLPLRPTERSAASTIRRTNP